MGLYVDRVLPRVTDVALGRADLREIRARVCAGLDGQVLEVGFGSGLNVPHYPPAVERVCVVDPATAGRKLAADRVAKSNTPVAFIGLDGERLPLETRASTTSSPPGRSAPSPTLGRHWARCDASCGPAVGCTSSNTAWPRSRRR